MFNAQTPPYCYDWYAVFLKGQRRVPGDKVLPSNVCIKNFDFHNRRNSRNITGTDPRNRSILKHAWYPFRFPMRTSGIIKPFFWVAWHPKNGCEGDCQIPGLRLGWDTWAAKWPAVGTKKEGNRFSLLPVSLLISLPRSVRRVGENKDRSAVEQRPCQRWAPDSKHFHDRKNLIYCNYDVCQS